MQKTDLETALEASKEKVEKAEQDLEEYNNTLTQLAEELGPRLAEPLPCEECCHGCVVLSDVQARPRE